MPNNSTKTPKYKITTNVPVVPSGTTLADAEKLLILKSKELETINYFYIVDSENKLLGVVSIKEVFRSPKTSKIEEFIKKSLVKAHVGTPRERIASIAIQNNIKAVPLVEKDGKFVGVITSDEIHRILHKDHTEMFLRTAGVGTFYDLSKDIVSGSVSTHFKRRFPWLAVGLLGGMIAAAAIGLFEATIQELAALVAFIPAITYIGDAIGNQTQTILIRSLAINPKLNLHKYILREFSVNLLLAIILAVAISGIVLLILNNTLLGIILGISFILTILVAMTVAIFVPLLFLKISIDPAVASGPLATVLRDITSLLVYFGVATAIISLFGVN